MSDWTKYRDERARRRELERNVAELKAMLKEKDARITELEEEIKNLNWQLDQEFKV